MKECHSCKHFDLSAGLCWYDAEGGNTNIACSLYEEASTNSEFFLTKKATFYLYCKKDKPKPPVVEVAKLIPGYRIRNMIYRDSTPTYTVFEVICEASDNG